MIISTGLDGLLSAALLHHHLGWEVTGYCDRATLWLSDQARENREKLVWVDLDICHPKALSLGRHVLTSSSGSPGLRTPRGGYAQGQGRIPTVLEHICNPNLLAGVSAENFPQRYPFSTIIFLLWLHDIAIRRDLVARLLVLHATATWMTLQRDGANGAQWQTRLPGYDWPWLFAQVDTELFERRMRDQLYAPLERLAALDISGRHRSRHLQLHRGRLRFNPDWDEDVFLKVGGFIGTHLKWSPPYPPHLTHRIDGQRKTAALRDLQSKDFPASLVRQGVFSYTISPQNKVNFAFINF